MKYTSLRNKSVNSQKTSQSILFMGRCENPEWRNITEYGGISRNMAEYHGIWRNITEYGEISRNIKTFSRNIPEYHKIYKSKPAERRDRSQSNGSHAPVYKHGRLTTYFITKVMDLSHFEGK